MACVLAIAVALGSLREFFFLNLNYQIDAVARRRSVSYAHSMFQGWVDGWDLAALLRLKWLLAALFSAAMAVCCVALARALFGDNRHMRAILLAYSLLGLVALALHALDTWHPAFGTIGVKLLHTLQYPVVLFFVWAGAILARTRV